MYKKHLKRVVDITLTLFGVIIMLPIITMLVLLVRIFLGKPVLFAQLRPGLYGKPFIMYKFRTMRNLYNAQGKLLPDEQRLTELGIFLRKFSLDELPELFNVLKGDMSLVGPRPLLMEYLPRYSVEQMRRHEVKPGVTGWGQINGRNGLNWEEKFKLDVWYIDHYSFLLDIKIILLTFLKVFAGKDVNTKENTIMPLFRGKEGV